LFLLQVGEQRTKKGLFKILIRRLGMPLFSGKMVPFLRLKKGWRRRSQDQVFFVQAP
jgi:hypothetical protein